MAPPPESFFTIGRKVGLVFVAQVVLLAAVCAVVVLNLLSMRADAEQLLEETREARLSSQLLVEIETLEGYLELMRAGPAVATAAEAPVRARLAAVRELLQVVDQGPAGGHDPSRVEHQASEEQITATIRSELDAIEQAIPAVVSGGAPLHLLRSRRYAAVLAGETHEEAERVNADLVRRTRNATWVMVATLLGAGVALGAVLWLVRRAIVLPIRALHDCAERLGRGDFSPVERRPRRRDEIGALTRSFEEMAARVAATQEELQERVTVRTRELMRAARYADIGVLAAGVAHEINNPLASIASSAEGLERRLARGEVDLGEQLDYLRTIASEAYRARDITSRLLALARQDRRPAEPVDLAHLFQQVALMTRHQLERRGIRLAVTAPARGPFVPGDAGELLQVVVNLVLNARDASPDHGTVWLRAEPQDNGVAIIVDDEGRGVPAELVDRIFDPFFTTKDPGEGTGLGLALVAAIAESHGGRVSVSRAPGRGARFTVWLRALEEIPT